MAQAWQEELHRIVGAHPCFLAKLIQPRVILLPSWLPGQTRAWVYLNLILVGHELNHAPLSAMRYVIAHEYGHIYRAHTALQFAYWTVLLTLIVAALADVPLLVVAALAGLTALSTSTMNGRTSNERELEADAVAARIYGPEAALEGAVGMAKTSGSMQQPERETRLKALGWKDARRKPR